MNEIDRKTTAVRSCPICGKPIETPDKIEAIDMGRRAIHNDGSRILMERLKGKVTVDVDTARRLFTLICVLHWKG